MIGVQPTFAGKAARELGVWQGIEQADHADGNGCLLDEFDHGICDRDLLAVEAHNEACGDEHPSAVYLVNALSDIAPGILLLLHRDQGRRIRTFDADENTEEVGRGHHFQEFRIIGQIDRSFCRKFERIVVRALPSGEFGKKQPERLLVADEVIVDDVEMAAVSHIVERIELGEHLWGRLGPRYPSVKFDDVAELAGEGAAARVLHTKIKIILKFEQVETRHRRLGASAWNLGAVKTPDRAPLAQAETNSSMI